MATLDKKDRQEVLDNDWMKVEVSFTLCVLNSTGHKMILTKLAVKR